jgi:hypothetical protein
MPTVRRAAAPSGRVRGWVLDERPPATGGTGEKAGRAADAADAVVSHVVLLKPRADLAAAERRSMVAALEKAVRTIPSIRGVRVGRRLRHGAGYEALLPDTADLLLIFDFDGLDGLRTYLAHPAHQELGRIFYESFGTAAAYDFENFVGDALQTLV